jgi:ribonuclease D
MAEDDMAITREEIDALVDIEKMLSEKIEEENTQLKQIESALKDQADKLNDLYENVDKVPQNENPEKLAKLKETVKETYDAAYSLYAICKEMREEFLKKSKNFITTLDLEKYTQEVIGPTLESILKINGGINFPEMN